MKDYSLFRLKCNCSTRMGRIGKMVKMYGRDRAVKCPNCGKEYIIRKKETKE